MIEVNGLTRYYGEFAALRDVSFRIEAGEIIGLLGLNGAGKSTTLKILAGLVAPSEGTVRFNGDDVTETPERVAAAIGFLPEDPPLYRDMSVTAFLRHIGRLKGMSSSQIEARLPLAIETAQLQGREHQIIDTLSHGYRKRVGIAQAVIHDPKLIILDEPISGLDPKQIVGMRQVIRSLADERAVIVSSHILSEISQTCDRILVIRDGQLVAQGTEDELAQQASVSSQRIKLLIRGSHEQLATFFDAQDVVSQCSLTQHSEALVEAELWLHSDAREALVANLVSAGFGLRQLTELDEDLEDIFLGLTETA